MTAVLLWKEYREHRSVWLALAGVAALALIGLRVAFAPHGLDNERDLRDVMSAIALMLAWTYGMVCGGMLLAGEREAGTQTFLDGLPAYRLQLWWRKCAIGGAFVLAQFGVLAGLGLSLAIVKSPEEIVLGALILVGFGLLGYVWGLLCSAKCQSVLAAIGLAVLGQIASAGIVLFPAYVISVLFAVLFGSGGGAVAFTLLSVLSLGVAPLVLSARVYSKTDRLRGPHAPLHHAHVARQAPWPGWQAVLWLSLRQARGLALGLALFSLLAGGLALAAPFLFWPLLTLGIGALCGATVFLDEQQGGAWRFLADQRFPLGRVWLVKVAVRFALTVGAVLIVLLPLVVVEGLSEAQNHQRNVPYGARLFRAEVLIHLVPPGLFVTMWALIGFGVGVLCGMLFRKPLVALVTAFGLSLLVAAAWGPSLLGGGLHAWQVLGPAAILTLAAWSLVHAWAAGRVASRTTVARLGAAVLGAVLWVAGGLAYRVAEAPAVEEPPEVAAFRATFPPSDKNQGGELVKRSCSRVEDLMRGAHKRPEPLRPNDAGPRPESYGERLLRVEQQGWPRDKGKSRELAAWLDKLFEDEWFGWLELAADKSPGVVEDPRRITIGSPLRAVGPARTIGQLLAARGLQLQAEGKPEAYVRNLRVGLALTRHLTNRSLIISAATGRAIEHSLLRGLERWLGALEDGPEARPLLARALKLLREHETACPSEVAEQEMAEYLVALNSLDAPEEWAFQEFGPGPSAISPALLKVARQVPWERARQERIVRAAAWGDEDQRTAALRLGRGTSPVWERGRHFTKERLLRRTCLLRAAQLQVALRLYQAANGEPAERLALLVSRRYLPEVPRDPFDEAPFRYRLSKGEALEWPGLEAPVPPGAGAPGPAPGGPPARPPGGPAPPAFGAPGPPRAGPGWPPPAPPPPPTKWVPRGWGILWSVGEDKHDDGGKRQARSNPSGAGEDLIFLVPSGRKNEEK